MATLLIAEIWGIYGIVVACLISVAVGLVYFYQSIREQSRVVVYVCILSLFFLLATIFLLPTDVALVSKTATRISRTGGRADADYADLDEAISNLKFVYHVLYSFDAIICFFVIPIVYFWYDEYDELATENGSQTHLKRLWVAFKSTLSMVVMMAVILVAAAALEIAAVERQPLPGLGVFWKLLTRNHCERFIFFIVGFLTTCGTLTYLIYTSIGLALLPISLIRSALSSSLPEVASAAASSLDYNTERQDHLNTKCRGNLRALSSRDRRELDDLTREERVLRRRLTLMEAERLHEQSLPMIARMRLSIKLEPLQGIIGVFLLGSSAVIFVSILLTSIDKIKDSVCGVKCFSLAQIHIINPLNFILTRSAKFFPLDFILFILLTIFLLGSSVCGIAMVGLRFLWMKIFAFRRGHTTPQALSLAIVLLALIGLAFNYALPMAIAPQYATYGSQKFCNHPSSLTGMLSDCHKGRENYIELCSHHNEKSLARGVCMPSVSSTFLTAMVTRFPFFGNFNMYAQLVFLTIYMTSFLIMILKRPQFGVNQLDEDAEEDEEESLLAHHGDPVGRTWNRLIHRSNAVRASVGYGSM
ncbi:hypothetical protein KEM54_003709 [Ascosphaera aggregata]|nr:hypothetical protein KEM54_003709 [Ascosphaera aggregata]